MIPGRGSARGLGLLDEPYDRAVVQAALAASLGLPLIGRAEEAVGTVETGLRAYSRLGGQLTLYEPSLLHVAKALAVASLGRLEEAEALAATGYEQALVSDDAAGLGVLRAGPRAGGLREGSVGRRHSLVERGLGALPVRQPPRAAGLEPAGPDPGPRHAGRGRHGGPGAERGGPVEPPGRLPRREPPPGPGVVGRGQGPPRRCPRPPRGRRRTGPGARRVADAD